MEKRGIFFSTDALIALSIIFLVVLIAVPLTSNFDRRVEVHSDSLRTLSSLKVHEFDNAYVQGLISSGVINNTNNSLLQQIGEFYVSDELAARAFAEAALSDVDFGNENFGLWYENTLIYSSNRTPIETANEVKTTRRIISGIKQGESVTGYSARAFLESSVQTKYFYFGGYVGDGNISAVISYNGNITSAEMELAVNRNFQLFVNGVASGNYSSSPSDFVPSTYEIPIDNFASGDNEIELRGNTLHISGGFVKVEYESEVTYAQPTRYEFPGIKGLINLYDGFYIPGEINSMSASLHLNSPINVFMTIGNVTVFNQSTSGEETITLSDAQLSSLLDYDTLWNETIPLRMGFENASFIYNISNFLDIASVTDLSSSMQNSCSGADVFCCFLQGGPQGCYTENICTTCFGTWEGKMDEAKAANDLFIDSILNITNTRVGLVGYASDVDEDDYHAFSTDDGSLKQQVDDWTPGGGTCICCGINRAVEGFEEESNSGTLKAMLVMSDGQATRECEEEQGQGTPALDAIQAACDAYEDHNITVHAVGFGDDAHEATLQSIADCGNGNYYFSDVEDLVEVYEDIAEDILIQYFIEQQIEVIGDLYSELFSDSYVEFNYNEPEVPTGLILSLEEQFDDAFEGTFSVPENSSVVEVIATSYSGPRWTDYVGINGEEVYRLPNYGDNYLPLGDPYAISIPHSFVNLTGSNTVRITTGTHPMNSSAGSASNKILYKVAKEVVSFSPIVSVAEGCDWDIEFDDFSNLTATIPSSYSGGNSCSYRSGAGGVSWDSNDAYQVSVYRLLRSLDLNSNQQVDILLTEENLEVTVDEIMGIPFPWSTEVQARVWE